MIVLLEVGSIIYKKAHNFFLSAWNPSFWSSFLTLNAKAEGNVYHPSAQLPELLQLPCSRHLIVTKNGEKAAGLGTFSTCKGRYYYEITKLLSDVSFLINVPLKLWFSQELGEKSAKLQSHKLFYSWWKKRTVWHLNLSLVLTHLLKNLQK